MAEESPETAGLIKELSSGVSSVRKRQEELADMIDALEVRVRRIEETLAAGASPRENGEYEEYDYRVLLHSRTYTIKDVDGRVARMEGVRRCLARRELPLVKTRYHTGSGDRDVAYSYRLLEDEGADPPWTPLDYRIEKQAGADYSASLVLAEPIRTGALFELRHELLLHDSFTTRNEWVTLVVQYPTDEFHLEVLIPPGRKLVGARREESQGASNSFNKRRVYPRHLNETGQTSLEWRETQPVTGRAYTLFWDW
ncbi:MAG: hypothetical protein OXL41_03475 [Nitrospinae bacterium]|nr:hypothetical protein [Nitrospinota bacterium]